jgi:hypothetical protein
LLAKHDITDRKGEKAENEPCNRALSQEQRRHIARKCEVVNKANALRHLGRVRHC